MLVLKTTDTIGDPNFIQLFSATHWDGSLLCETG